MKFKGTYQELFQYSVELNNFGLEYPAVTKLLGKGYKQFENRNKMALNQIREKLAVLYEENIEKGEDGQPVMAEGNVGWKFKSSLHENSFNADWSRLMSTECTIVIGDDMQMH